MIDHPLDPVIPDQLADPVDSAQVVRKSGTGAGPGRTVGKRAYHAVHGPVTNSRRVIKASFTHTGFICRQKTAHAFDQQRKLEIGKNNGRAGEQNPGTVFFHCHFICFCPAFQFPVQRG